MRVLVTGAAGFVGSHCVRTLQERGHTVVALVRPGSEVGRLEGCLGGLELQEGLELREVELTDVAGTMRAVGEAGADAIIHLAWYAEPRRYLHDVERNLESLQASLVLLRAGLTAAVGRIVLAGTCLEAVRLQPDSIYAQAKRCAHQVGLDPAVQETAAVACAHVFTPFGPGEHSGRAIPSVVRSLLQGQPVSVSEGTQRRDYIHVSDAASALVTLAETSLRGAVDVCTGESRQVRDVFSTIGDILGRSELLRWGGQPVGPGESFDAEGDPTGICELGWRPRFSFEGGLEDSIRWWRAQLATAGGLS